MLQRVRPDLIRDWADARFASTEYVDQELDKKTSSFELAEAKANITNHADKLVESLRLVLTRGIRTPFR